MTIQKWLIPCVAGSFLMLAACSSGQSSSSGGIAATIDRSISSAMDKAQAKLRTQPISVSQNDDNLPKAEIAPDGDFIVGGKKVAITPEQRNALLEYRKQLISVAEQGIAIGKQGATLGVRAASEAIAGAFSGKSDKEIEQRVRAQTTGIRDAATKICERLPAVMAEQQQLATILPAFKPYATMTEKDVVDCRSDALKGDSD